MILSGCVPIPQEQRSQFPTDNQEPPAQTSGFQGLDAGAAEVASLHFVVRAYGSDKARQLSELAEAVYSRIMTDTQLYTFQPPGLDNILLYANKDEYAKKTQQPDWSDGIMAGNTIYVHDGPQLGSELAHQMSHLVFYQYMASPRQDYRWLDEGLAIYQEIAQMTAEGLRSDWRTQWQNAFKARAVPFDQMIALVPATEHDRLNDLWHEEAGDVVRFMIERGGRNGFSQFLKSIRDGHNLDDAIRAGYGGTWNRFSDLESAWKQSL